MLMPRSRNFRPGIGQRYSDSRVVMVAVDSHNNGSQGLHARGWCSEHRRRRSLRGCDGLSLHVADALRPLSAYSGKLCTLTSQPRFLRLPSITEQFKFGAACTMATPASREPERVRANYRGPGCERSRRLTVSSAYTRVRRCRVLRAGNGFLPLLYTITSLLYPHSTNLIWKVGTYLGFINRHRQRSSMFG